jgi:adenylate cyclase
VVKKLRILIPLFLLILFGTAQFFEWIPMLDNFIYDDFLSGEREPKGNIIIVGMDERSIREIGTWPWPRLFMADTIEKLTGLGVAAIGTNVLYDSYGTNEEHDAMLVEAASGTDRLVLASQCYFATERDFIAEDYILPFEPLAKVTASGFINVKPDEDGVLRRALTTIRYGDISVYSLPLEVYRTYCRVMGIEDNIDAIPLDSMGRFPIKYAGGPGSFRTVSLWGVINDYYNPEIFKDAIVLIGPYAQGISGRNFTTPLDRRTATYNIEIDANIIQNMLEGRFKQEAEWWLNLSIFGFMGLVVLIFFTRIKPLPAIIITLLLIAAQLGGAKLVFERYDLILKSGDIIIFLILSYIANLVLGIVAVHKEKNHIHGLFGRFVARLSRAM